jgi:type VI secretion system secreted protein Hcp
MAVDMFLKITGIKGESADAKHKDEIEVLAWSWGASHPDAVHSGGGTGAGKVAVHDLSISKHFDVASPALLLACCQGTHIPEATLTVRKSAPSFEFCTIAMKDVLITSLNMSADEPGGIWDSVSLTFGQVKVTYTPSSETGKARALVSAGWDLKQNKKI